MNAIGNSTASYIAYYLRPRTNWKRAGGCSDSTRLLSYGFDVGSVLLDRSPQMLSSELVLRLLDGESVCSVAVVTSSDMSTVPG